MCGIIPAYSVSPWCFLERAWYHPFASPVGGASGGLCVEVSGLSVTRLLDGQPGEVPRRATVVEPRISHARFKTGIPNRFSRDRLFHTMAKSNRLIIGLGNPGAEYEATRHNIGFAVVDAVAEKARAELSYDGRAEAMVGEGRVRGRSLTLVKPLTYMNRSGLSVRHLVRRYDLTPADLLVIYDDINLPPGKLRLREKGSAGGHNGLQDIIDRLGTDRFPRLRFGVGDDFSRGRQSDYVLSPFTKEQQPDVELALVQARDAAITFVAEGLVKAMNRFN